MVKKKNEEKKEKPLPKKINTVKNKSDDVIIPIKKYSISELLQKNSSNALNTVGFLNYYGLSEDFRKEFETGKAVKKFSEGEFRDMYERYKKREI